MPFPVKHLSFVVARAAPTDANERFPSPSLPLHQGQRERRGERVVERGGGALSIAFPVVEHDPGHSGDRYNLLSFSVCYHTVKLHRTF